MTNLQEKTQRALPDFLAKQKKDKGWLAVKSGVSLSVIEKMLDGQECEEHLWRQVFKFINPEIMDGVYITSDLQVGQNAANAATGYNKKFKKEYGVAPNS